MDCLDEAAPGSTHDVTRLLQALASSDKVALERLMPLVYDELHRLAHRYMAAEQPSPTLQTTALVHEVYLRLVDVNNIDWQNRAHFYGLCARLMRRILVDFARSRNYHKRVGHFPHIEYDESATVSEVIGSVLLDVDEAQKQLSVVEARSGDVVTFR